MVLEKAMVNDLDTIPISQIIKPNRRPHQKHRQRKVDWRRLLERRVAPAETCAQPKPVEVPSRAVRVKDAADAPFCSPNRNPSVTGEADVGQHKVPCERLNGACRESGWSRGMHMHSRPIVDGSFLFVLPCPCEKGFIPMKQSHVTRRLLRATALAMTE